MQSKNDQNERVRPKLESASELKGKKAEEKAAANGGKKRLMTVLSLVLVLAIVIGVYFVTRAREPVEEEDNSSSSATQSIKLIEDRHKNDMARMTVLKDGKEQFTIISNLKEKADEAAAAEEAADAAETSAPEDAEELPEQAEADTGTAPETEETVEKQDYEIEGLPYFTTDTSKIDRMVTYSYSLVSSKLIEENSGDLSIYGLTNPTMQILFAYHDGTSVRLNIGDKVAAGNYYYLTLDDSKDVYMVYANAHDYFDCNLNDLHAIPTLPTVEITSVKDFLVAQRGQETIEIKLNETTEESLSVISYGLVQPIKYDVNTERSEEIMTAATGISISAYADYAADEEALAAFGLDDPYLVVDLIDANDAHMHYEIGDEVADNASYRYIKVDDTGDVYTVDTSQLSFLTNCRVSYVVDQFTNLINIKRITGFEIETEDTTYTATVESTPYVDDYDREQVEQTFTFEGQPAEEDVFRDFYQVLVGTLFDKRIENEDEYYFDGEVKVRVTYHLTYTDEPYVIEYLDYDRDYYAIRREGVCLFLIRKEKIQNVVDTAELYRNGEYTGNSEN